MSDGRWNWRTAISADGVVADVIQANGTLSGVNIVGGTLKIGRNYDGSYNFDVDSSGNVIMKKGSINLGNNAFKVDNNGNVTISKGSISIGNNFSVDSYGNVKIGAGSININNGAFRVDQWGNVYANSYHGLHLERSDALTGEIDFSNLRVYNLTVGNNVSMGENATITWGQVSEKPTNLAYKGDIPSYITSTKITKTSIESPTFTGNVINSTTFKGGVYETWSNGYYGGQLDSTGFHVYRGTTPIGDLCYTNSNFWNRNMNAVLLNSYNGYALKINSSSDMSIEANGILYLKGSKISFCECNLVFDRCQTSGLVAKFG